MPTNPWDRRPGESEEAYRAFLIYRDLGASRSLDAVGRVTSGGQVGDKRAKTGRLASWSSSHAWVERSRAWDDHLQSQRQAAIEKTTRDEAGEWERRRQQQARDDYDLGRQFLKQARTLAAFPVTDQTIAKDGKATTIRAIDPRQLKEAAAIAQVGRQMTWDAIREALPPDDDDDFDPETATVEENRAYVARKARARKAPDRRA